MQNGREIASPFLILNTLCPFCRDSDHAFLAETVLPTLLPGLVELQEKVEKNQSDQENRSGSISTVPAINPIRWLAEYLIRHHPQSDSILNTRGPLAEQLRKSATVLKERRLQREEEGLVLKSKLQAEKLKLESEAARLDEEKRKKQQEIHAKEMEAKDQEQNKKGEKAAVSAIGISKAALILTFRNTCISFVNSFDYHAAFESKNSQSDLDSMLYKETCQFLVSNSPASFAAAVSLLDVDTLHYHTTASKREQPAEGESRSGLASIPTQSPSLFRIFRMSRST